GSGQRNTGGRAGGLPPGTGSVVAAAAAKPGGPGPQGRVRTDVHQQGRGRLLPEKGCALPHLAGCAASARLPSGISVDRVQVRASDPTEPGVRYPEYHGGTHAVDRTADCWSLLFSEVEEGRGSIKGSRFGHHVPLRIPATRASSAQASPASAPMSGTVAAKNPWGREKKRMLESGLPLSSPLTMMTTIRESRTCSLTFYSKAEMRMHSRSHTLRPSPTSAHAVAALRQQLLPDPAHARTPASTPGHAGVHSQATPLSTHTVKQGVHLRRLQPGLHAGTTPDATHDAQTHPS
ncbi:hypothetical protein E2I00_011867, partial [Balaenoptera physalus]